MPGHWPLVCPRRFVFSHTLQPSRRAMADKISNPFKVWRKRWILANVFGLRADDYPVNAFKR
jgi:hypothetical protein